jgi:hypothetical protein
MIRGTAFTFDCCSPIGLNMKTELTPLSNRAANLFAFASSSRCECEKDRFWLVIHFDRKMFLGTKTTQRGHVRCGLPPDSDRRHPPIQNASVSPAGLFRGSVRNVRPSKRGEQAIPKRVPIAGTIRG